MEDTLNLIVDRCHKIKNTRTPESILDHMSGEVEELSDEVAWAYVDLPPGEDGILGEAIDVLLCAIDHEVMVSGITAADIQLKVIQKLDKWERLYG